jgi:hypothetical protein
VKQNYLNVGYVFSNSIRNATSSRCFGVLVDQYSKRVQVSYLSTAGVQQYLSFENIGLFTMSEWHSIFVTVNSTNYVSVYFDGTLASVKQALATVSLCNTTSAIGSETAGGFAFQGSLRRVRIYDFLGTPDLAFAEKQICTQLQGLQCQVLLIEFAFKFSPCAFQLVLFLFFFFRLLSRLGDELG